MQENHRNRERAWSKSYNKLNGLTWYFQFIKIINHHIIMMSVSVTFFFYELSALIEGSFSVWLVLTVFLFESSCLSLFWLSSLEILLLAWRYNINDYNLASYYIWPNFYYWCFDILETYMRSFCLKLFLLWCINSSKFCFCAFSYYFTLCFFLIFLPIYYYR